MKKQLFILSAVTLFSLTEAKAAGKLYVGGGYQLTNVNYGSPVPQGSYTVTEEVEVVDSAEKIDNGDGTFTETIESHIEEQSVNRVGGYLDYGDYYAKIYNSFFLFAGLNLTDRQALELSYSYQSKDKDNNNSNEFIYDGATAQSSSTLQIISLDMVMSNPVIDEVADLNIIIGGSLVNFKTESDFYINGAISESESRSYNDFGFNLGIGFDTKISQRTSVVSRIKGVFLPNSDIMDSIFIANVGLKITL